MLNGVAETCIYATNLAETGNFYSEVLGFEIVLKDEGRHIFFKCGDNMLLMFNPDHTLNKQTDVDGNLVPRHGATGPVHVAYSVNSDRYHSVKQRITDHGVSIESEVSWPNDSQSFYFRDPANNSLEIITGNMWK